MVRCFTPVFLLLVLFGAFASSDVLAQAETGIPTAAPETFYFVSPVLLELRHTPGDPGPENRVVATLRLNDRCTTESAVDPVPRWRCEKEGVERIGYARKESFRATPWTVEALNAKKAEIDASTTWRRETNPKKRDALLAWHREEQFTWLARLCAIDTDVMPCLLAMQLRADAEATAAVKTLRETREGLGHAAFKCERAGDDNVRHPLRDCIRSSIGKGLPVFLAGAGGTPGGVLVFVPRPPSSVRIVLARSDLWPEDFVVVSDTTAELPIMLETLQHATAGEPRHLEMRPEIDRDVGRVSEGIYRSLPETQDITPGPNADGAFVICEREVKALGPLVAIVEKTDVMTERPYLEYQHRAPCPSGFVIGRDAPGIRLGKFRRFHHWSMSSGQEPGPGVRVVDGQNIQRFGRVTFRQVVADHRKGLDQATCHLEQGKTSMAISSYYGCELEFAGDLNRDGLSDFVIRTGHESCEASSLYMSSKAGWSVVADGEGCE